jgi:HlyD family secretion protein
MRKPLRRVAVLSAVALPAASLFYWLAMRQNASADFDPAHVARVERRPMVRSVVATGKIEPITKVEIKSKANGIIKRLEVQVGDLVRSGDVLAELDKDNLEARAREARANLDAARAALTVLQAELQKAAIDAASPQVEFARRTLDRAQKLAGQSLVSQSDLDSAQSSYDSVENRKLSAEQEVEVTRARIGQARANVEQAAAAVERTEEELRNATIRAPIEGTVLTRDVEIGSPVSSILNLGSAGTLVFTLGNIERVFVRGRVDESDIGRVRLRQPARITVESFKDRVFDGTVTLISPIGAEKDNVTTFQVEVSIANPGRDLRANMTANAEIVLEERPDTLSVPMAAIQYDAERRPYVEKPSAAAPKARVRVPVKLGITTGTRAEIVEGLIEGDRVLLP